VLTGRDPAGDGRNLTVESLDLLRHVLPQEGVDRQPDMVNALDPRSHQPFKDVPLPFPENNPKCLQ
jgi:hypothetical protein